MSNSDSISDIISNYILDDEKRKKVVEYFKGLTSYKEKKKIEIFKLVSKYADIFDEFCMSILSNDIVDENSNVCEHNYRAVDIYNLLHYLPLYEPYILLVLLRDKDNKAKMIINILKLERDKKNYYNNLIKRP